MHGDTFRNVDEASRKIGPNCVGTAVRDGDMLRIYNEPVNMRHGQSEHNLECQVRGAKVSNPDKEVITIKGGNCYD